MMQSTQAQHVGKQPIPGGDIKKNGPSWMTIDPKIFLSDWFSTNRSNIIRCTKKYVSEISEFRTSSKPKFLSKLKAVCKRIMKFLHTHLTTIEGKGLLECDLEEDLIQLFAVYMDIKLRIFMLMKTDSQSSGPSRLNMDTSFLSRSSNYNTTIPSSLRASSSSSSSNYGPFAISTPQRGIGRGTTSLSSSPSLGTFSGSSVDLTSSKYDGDDDLSVAGGGDIDVVDVIGKGFDRKTLFNLSNLSNSEKLMLNRISYWMYTILTAHQQRVDALLSLSIDSRNTKIRPILDVIFRKVLSEMPEGPLTGVSYVRHMLAFKIWRERVISFDDFASCALTAHIKRNLVPVNYTSFPDSLLKCLGHGKTADEHMRANNINLMNACRDFIKSCRELTAEIVDKIDFERITVIDDCDEFGDDKVYEMENEISNLMTLIEERKSIIIVDLTQEDEKPNISQLIPPIKTTSSTSTSTTNHSPPESTINLIPPTNKKSSTTTFPSPPQKTSMEPYVPSYPKAERDIYYVNFRLKEVCQCSHSSTNHCSRNNKSSEERRSYVAPCLQIAFSNEGLANEDDIETEDEYGTPEEDPFVAHQETPGQNCNKCSVQPKDLKIVNNKTNLTNKECGTIKNRTSDLKRNVRVKKMPKTKKLQLLLTTKNTQISSSVEKNNRNGHDLVTSARLSSSLDKQNNKFTVSLSSTKNNTHDLLSNEDKLNTETQTTTDELQLEKHEEVLEKSTERILPKILTESEIVEEPSTVENTETSKEISTDADKTIKYSSEFKENENINKLNLDSSCSSPALQNLLDDEINKYTKNNEIESEELQDNISNHETELVLNDNENDKQNLGLITDENISQNKDILADENSSKIEKVNQIVLHEECQNLEIINDKEIIQQESEIVEPEIEKEILQTEDILQEDNIAIIEQNKPVTEETSTLLVQAESRNIEAEIDKDILQTEDTFSDTLVCSEVQNIEENNEKKILHTEDELVQEESQNVEAINNKEVPHTDDTLILKETQNSATKIVEEIVSNEVSLVQEDNSTITEQNQPDTLTLLVEEECQNVEAKIDKYVSQAEDTFSDTLVHSEIQDIEENNEKKILHTEDELVQEESQNVEVICNKEIPHTDDTLVLEETQNLEPKIVEETLSNKVSLVQEDHSTISEENQRVVEVTATLLVQEESQNIEIKPEDTFSDTLVYSEIQDIEENNEKKILDTEDELVQEECQNIEVISNKEIPHTDDTLIIEETQNSEPKIVEEILSDKVLLVQEDNSTITEENQTVFEDTSTLLVEEESQNIEAKIDKDILQAEDTFSKTLVYSEVQDVEENNEKKILHTEDELVQEDSQNIEVICVKEIPHTDNTLVLEDSMYYTQNSAPKIVEEILCNEDTLTITEENQTVLEDTSTLLVEEESQNIEAKIDKDISQAEDTFSNTLVYTEVQDIEENNEKKILHTEDELVQEESQNVEVICDKEIPHTDNTLVLEEPIYYTQNSAPKIVEEILCNEDTLTITEENQTSVEDTLTISVDVESENIESKIVYEILPNEVSVVQENSLKIKTPTVIEETILVHEENQDIESNTEKEILQNNEIVPEIEQWKSVIEEVVTCTSKLKSPVRTFCPPTEDLNSKNLVEVTSNSNIEFYTKILPESTHQETVNDEKYIINQENVQEVLISKNVIEQEIEIQQELSLEQLNSTKKLVEDEQMFVAVEEIVSEEAIIDNVQKNIDTIENIDVLEKNNLKDENIELQKEENSKSVELLKIQENENVINVQEEKIILDKVGKETRKIKVTNNKKIAKRRTRSTSDNQITIQQRRRRTECDLLEGINSVLDTKRRRRSFGDETTIKISKIIKKSIINKRTRRKSNVEEKVETNKAKTVQFDLENTQYISQSDDSLSEEIQSSEDNLQENDKQKSLLKLKPLQIDSKPNLRRKQNLKDTVRKENCIRNMEHEEKRRLVILCKNMSQEEIHKYSNKSELDNVKQNKKKLKLKKKLFAEFQNDISDENVLESVKIKVKWNKLNSHPGRTKKNKNKLKIFSENFQLVPSEKSVETKLKNLKTNGEHMIDIKESHLESLEDDLPLTIRMNYNLDTAKHLINTSDISTKEITTRLNVLESDETARKDIEENLQNIGDKSTEDNVTHNENNKSISWQKRVLRQYTRNPRQSNIESKSEINLSSESTKNDKLITKFVFDLEEPIRNDIEVKSLKKLSEEVIERTSKKSAIVQQSETQIMSSESDTNLKQDLESKFYTKKTVSLDKFEDLSLKTTETLISTNSSQIDLKNEEDKSTNKTQEKIKAPSKCYSRRAREKLLKFKFQPRTDRKRKSKTVETSNLLKSDSNKSPEENLTAVVDNQENSKLELRSSDTVTKDLTEKIIVNELVHDFATTEIKSEIAATEEACVDENSLAVNIPEKSEIDNSAVLINQSNLELNVSDTVEVPVTTDVQNKEIQSLEKLEDEIVVEQIVQDLSQQVIVSEEEIIAQNIPVESEQIVQENIAPEVEQSEQNFIEKIDIIEEVVVINPVIVSDDIELKNNEKSITSVENKPNEKIEEQNAEIIIENSDKTLSQENITVKQTEDVADTEKTTLEIPENFSEKVVESITNDDQKITETILDKANVKVDLQTPKSDEKSNDTTDKISDIFETKNNDLLEDATSENYENNFSPRMPIVNYESSDTEMEEVPELADENVKEITNNANDFVNKNIFTVEENVATSCENIVKEPEIKNVSSDIIENEKEKLSDEKISYFKIFSEENCTIEKKQCQESDNLITTDSLCNDVVMPDYASTEMPQNLNEFGVVVYKVPQYDFAYDDASNEDLIIDEEIKDKSVTKGDKNIKKNKEKNTEESSQEVVEQINDILDGYDEQSLKSTKVEDNEENSNTCVREIDDMLADIEDHKNVKYESKESSTENNNKEKKIPEELIVTAQENSENIEENIVEFVELVQELETGKQHQLPQNPIPEILLICPQVLETCTLNQDELLAKVEHAHAIESFYKVKAEFYSHPPTLIEDSTNNASIEDTNDNLDILASAAMHADRLLTKTENNNLVQLRKEKSHDHLEKDNICLIVAFPDKSTDLYNKKTSENSGSSKQKGAILENKIQSLMERANKKTTPSKCEEKSLETILEEQIRSLVKNKSSKEMYSTPEQKEENVPILSTIENVIPIPFVIPDTTLLHLSPDEDYFGLHQEKIFPVFGNNSVLPSQQSYDVMKTPIHTINESIDHSFIDRTIDSIVSAEPKEKIKKVDEKVPEKPIKTIKESKKSKQKPTRTGKDFTIANILKTNIEIYKNSHNDQSSQQQKNNQTTSCCIRTTRPLRMVTNGKKRKLNDDSTSPKKDDKITECSENKIIKLDENKEFKSVLPFPPEEITKKIDETLPSDLPNIVSSSKSSEEIQVAEDSKEIVKEIVENVLVQENSVIDIQGQMVADEKVCSESVESVVKAIENSVLVEDHQEVEKIVSNQVIDAEQSQSIIDETNENIVSQDNHITTAVVVETAGDNILKENFSQNINVDTNIEIIPEAHKSEEENIVAEIVQTEATTNIMKDESLIKKDESVTLQVEIPVKSILDLSEEDQSLNQTQQITNEAVQQWCNRAENKKSLESDNEITSNLTINECFFEEISNCSETANEISNTQKTEEKYNQYQTPDSGIVLDEDSVQKDKLESETIYHSNKFDLDNQQEIQISHAFATESENITSLKVSILWSRISEVKSYITNLEKMRAKEISVSLKSIRPTRKRKISITENIPLHHNKVMKISEETEEQEISASLKPIKSLDDNTDIKISEEIEEQIEDLKTDEIKEQKISASLKSIRPTRKHKISITEDVPLEDNTDKKVSEEIEEQMEDLKRDEIEEQEISASFKPTPKHKIGITEDVPLEDNTDMKVSEKIEQQIEDLKTDEIEEQEQDTEVEFIDTDAESMETVVESMETVVESVETDCNSEIMTSIDEIASNTPKETVEEYSESSVTSDYCFSSPYSPDLSKKQAEFVEETGIDICTNLEDNYYLSFDDMKEQRPLQAGYSIVSDNSKDEQSYFVASQLSETDDYIFGEDISKTMVTISMDKLQPENVQKRKPEEQKPNEFEDCETDNGMSHIVDDICQELDNQEEQNDIDDSQITEIHVIAVNQLPTDAYQEIVAATSNFQFEDGIPIQSEVTYQTYVSPEVSESSVKISEITDVKSESISSDQMYLTPIVVPIETSTTQEENINIPATIEQIEEKILPHEAGIKFKSLPSNSLMNYMNAVKEKSKEKNRVYEGIVEEASYGSSHLEKSESVKKSNQDSGKKLAEVRTYPPSQKQKIQTAPTKAIDQKQKLKSYRPIPKQIPVDPKHYLEKSYETEAFHNKNVQGYTTSNSPHSAPSYKQYLSNRSQKNYDTKPSSYQVKPIETNSYQATKSYTTSPNILPPPASYSNYQKLSSKEKVPDPRLHTSKSHYPSDDKHHIQRHGYQSDHSRQRLNTKPGYDSRAHGSKSHIDQRHYKTRSDGSQSDHSNSSSHHSNVYPGQYIQSSFNYREDGHRRKSSSSRSNEQTWAASEHHRYHHETTERKVINTEPVKKEESNSLWSNPILNNQLERCNAYYSKRNSSS